MYLNEERAPLDVKANTPISSSEANSPPSTRQALDARPVPVLVRDPSFSDYSIDALFAALHAACESRDDAKAIFIRNELLAIYSDEVFVNAAERLRALLGPDRSSQPRSALLVFCIMALVVPREPELILTSCRTKWRDDSLAEDMRISWLVRKDRSEGEKLLTLLDEDTKRDCVAVAHVVRIFLHPPLDISEAPLSVLDRLYGNTVPLTEIPDPWLSAVLHFLIHDDPEVSQDPRVVEFLRNLLVNTALSTRLRAQVATYLAGGEETLTELLRSLQDAVSTRHAAKLVAKYIELHTLSPADARLLLLALKDMLLDTKNGYLEVGLLITKQLEDANSIDNLNTLSSILLDGLVSENGDTELGAWFSGEFLEGMRQGWPQYERTVGSVVPFFDASLRPDLAGNFEKLRQKDYGSVELNIALRSRTLGLLWASPLSMKEKLQITTTHVDSMAELSLADAIAILYGMGRCSKDLGTSFAGDVASIVDRIILVCNDFLVGTAVEAYSISVAIRLCKLSTVWVSATGRSADFCNRSTCRKSTISMQ